MFVFAFLTILLVQNTYCASLTTSIIPTTSMINATNSTGVTTNAIITSTSPALTSNDFEIDVLIYEVGLSTPLPEVIIDSYDQTSSLPLLTSTALQVTSSSKIA